MGEAMVDSWILATITMWVVKLNYSEVIKLVETHFNWDDLWEAATLVNKLCEDRNMNLKIPKNRDQGVEKNRIAVLGSNILNSIQELKSRADKPIFVVSSGCLFNVPGVIKDNINVEPAVTARLEGIEKMVENLSKSFKEM